MDGGLGPPATEFGPVRRAVVRTLAVLGVLTFGFMLVFVVTDSIGRVGQPTELVAAESPEAVTGAAHPGEAVHVVGTIAALMIGGSGLLGLVARPQRAGSATQTGAVAIAMLITSFAVGNPDNHGGQAGLVDPAFAIMAVPPLGAALAAAPWRGWRRGRDRRLLVLSIVAVGGVLYGLDQGLMQRNTWPPLADPHHQAHWWAMSLLGFMIALVSVAVVLRGSGWRVAATTAGAAAIALGAVSLVAVDAASALQPVWAVLAIAWGVAVLVVSWRIERPEVSAP